MNLQALLPHIILSIAAVAVLLATSVRRNHSAAVALTLAGLIGAFLSLWPTATGAPHVVSDLLIIDRFALFLTGLILLLSSAIVLLACNYFSSRHENREEFYIVLLLAVLGSIVLVAANHFVSFFLGLEILTVSLYVMIAYLRTEDFALEAGVKYLILAAASSAFMLFGIALLYAATGTMNFQVLAQKLTTTAAADVFLVSGTVLFLVGVAFKLAVAPFHMWTPDVYQGAPAPATAFVATVSKGAVIGVLLRFFVTMDGYDYPALVLALSVVSIASMLLGNFLALLQKNLKRLLAYSSIAHLGYLLVALLAGGNLATEAVLYYLVAYTITITGAFAVVGILADDNETVDLDDYRGLFWHRPWPAAALTAMMLSLAGIPLTAGFVGKFFVVSAGVGASLWTLAIVLVIGSAVSIYYYVRVVAVMFSRPETETEKPVITMPVLGRFVLVLLTVALIFFGLVPGPLTGLIRSVVSGVL